MANVRNMLQYFNLIYLKERSFIWGLSEAFEWQGKQQMVLWQTFVRGSSVQGGLKVKSKEREMNFHCAGFKFIQPNSFCWVLRREKHDLELSHGRVWCTKLKFSPMTKPTLLPSQHRRLSLVQIWAESKLFRQSCSMRTEKQSVKRGTTLGFGCGRGRFKYLK